MSEHILTPAARYAKGHKRYMKDIGAISINPLFLTMHNLWYYMTAAHGINVTLEQDGDHYEFALPVAELLDGVSDSEWETQLVLTGLRFNRDHHSIAVYVETLSDAYTLQGLILFLH